MNKSTLPVGIKTMIGWKNKGTLTFDNPIQRSGSQWTLLQKSLLIHSILMGYPIPNCYFLKTKDENGNTVYDCLDAKQRLTSVFDFVEGEYELHSATPPCTVDGFEFDLANLSFEELADDLKDEILGCRMSIFCLEDCTDEEVEEIFARLNNSTPLSPIQKCRSIMSTELARWTKEICSMSYSDDIGKMGSILGEVTGVLSWEEQLRPINDNKQIKDYSICLENVRFSYREKEVLHGVNLKIESGTVNALVGPSGSGKSTIAKLIASLWDVDSGSIKIGGVDISELSLKNYNRKIAYVSQDNYLFDNTIRENIRMGDLNATDKQVEQAAKDCGCHEFIMALPDGYDTIVGSAGGHLSGGERQRISIARAMLKNAPIIILDEATAYTDPENEALIQHSVAKLIKGKTLIVIAHRLSTIVDADQIFVIENGTVAETGTHNELLANGEIYSNMWRAHMSVKDSEQEVEPRA